jgi:salicylate hydroxylase
VDAHDRAPITGAADMAHERIALVGDAAHPMVPYLAQGAGMAIEDAVALADALGDGGRPRCRPRSRAMPKRAGRAMRRCRRGPAATARSSMPTGAVRAGRDMAMRLLGAKLLDQPWLYGG